MGRSSPHIQPYGWTDVNSPFKVEIFEYKQDNLNFPPFEILFLSSRCDTWTLPQQHMKQISRQYTNSDVPADPNIQVVFVKRHGCDLLPEGELVKALARCPNAPILYLLDLPLKKESILDIEKLNLSALRRLCIDIPVAFGKDARMALWNSSVLTNITHLDIVAIGIETEDINAIQKLVPYLTEFSLDVINPREKVVKACFTYWGSNSKVAMLDPNVRETIVQVRITNALVPLRGGDGILWNDWRKLVLLSRKKMEGFRGSRKNLMEVYNIS